MGEGFYWGIDGRLMLNLFERGGAVNIMDGAGGVSARYGGTMRITLHSRSQSDTHAIGRAIGAGLSAGDILLLSGTLGAGKTTLTQGIAWGLGADEYARSPTFVLVNEYAARLPIYHMDLYRLDSFAEVDGLGLDDYLFGDGVCVIEWADKVPGYFPEERLYVEIAVASNEERALTISGSAERHAALFDALAGTEYAASPSKSETPGTGERA